MTGRPRTLRCARCKKGANTWNARQWDYRPRAGTNLVRTGKTKRRSSISKHLSYQYACLNCGHVGWTWHESAPRLPLLPVGLIIGAPPR
jgi:predicted RNA-binding Zn-ribbon protein involved in translation (DUF1610 family)